jgi:hypothetical protein
VGVSEAAGNDGADNPQTQTAPSCFPDRSRTDPVRSQEVPRLVLLSANSRLINASNVKDLVKEISPFIPRPVKDLLSRLKPPTIQELAALENIDCKDMVVYILIGDVANPGDDKGEFAYAGSATEVGKGYHRRLVEYARNHQL